MKKKTKVFGLNYLRKDEKMEKTFKESDEEKLSNEDIIKFANEHPEIFEK